MDELPVTRPPRIAQVIVGSPGRKQTTRSRRKQSESTTSTAIELLYKISKLDFAMELKVKHSVLVDLNIGSCLLPNHIPMCLEIE